MSSSLTKFRELQSRLRELIPVNRSIDAVSATMWFIYGLWGVLYGLASTQTLIHRLTSTIYTTVWGSGIGVAALIATASCAFILFPHTKRVREFATRTELYAVVFMTVFIAAYPLFQVVNLFVRPVQLIDFAATVLAFSYLVLPIWRIYELTRRMKARWTPPRT